MGVMKPRNGRKRMASFSSFLFFLCYITSFLLFDQFADPVFAVSSSPTSSSLSRRALIHGNSDRSKKSSFVLSTSPSHRREWKLSPASLNSSRNARQVPEIPALYSAPEQIPTPDLPALYSAPKFNSPENLEDSQNNEVDSRSATTEIIIGGNDEEDETSSEDIQYGVPTEKYLMSDDSNSNQDDSPNEYPTDSPLPQATYLPPVVGRTNDAEFDEDEETNVEDETTEDSYSAGGYNSNEPSSKYGPPKRNGKNEPSSQYGPPQTNSKVEPSPQYGPPQQNKRKNGSGNGAKKQKMQSSPTSSSHDSGSGNRHRSPDQQQTENSVQPTTRKNNQHQGNPRSQAPQPGYLPPVFQPPSSPQQQPQDSPPQRDDKVEPHQQEIFSNTYGSSQVEDYDQQPPNPNYHTLPHQHQHQEESSNEPRQQNSLQDLSDYGEEGRSSQQSHGQYFGNNQQQQQPNSFYGPPAGVNHFQGSSQQHHSNNIGDRGGEGNREEELEGLNEKIVDAELLERVQQIIEDHERQQKVLLDKIQQDNEKALHSSHPPDISSPPSGNKLSSGRGGEGNNNDNSNAVFTPYPYYGPPSSNGYPNSNSAQPAEAYLPPASSSPSYQQNPAIRSNPNSSQDRPQQGERDNKGEPSSLNKMPADVQVQKAVLSRHFTQTEPDSGLGYNNNGNKINDGSRNRQSSFHIQNNNQLNSEAGPGQEYLPPSASQSHQQHQQDLTENLQNSGHLNSIQSGDVKKPDDDRYQHGYSVKVGTGITVDAASRHISTSGGSENPYMSTSVVYGVPALLSSQPTTFQNSRQFHPSQDAVLPFPRVMEERFPSSLHQYQAPSQQQQQQHEFPQTSEFWSRNRAQPQHTLASSTPHGPQTQRYGPPSSMVLIDNNINNGNNHATGEIEGRPPYQINYSNVVENSNQASDSGREGEYNQRSHKPQQPQQYLPPVPSNHQTSSNTNGNQVPVPRPIYGVPLAPIITLDSSSGDNNLHNNFNSDNENNPSYSPDATKVGGSSAPGPPTTNYYLPPTTLPSSSSKSNREIGEYQQRVLSNSLNLQQQRGTPEGGMPSHNNHYNDDSSRYGPLPFNNNDNVNNNPSSSSSSTYLMIQGHNGNSNNHIYNINHNSYDGTASFGAGILSHFPFAISSSGSSSSSTSSHYPVVPRIGVDHDDGSSSIIIPGISDTFSLPIYDYSPSHQHLANENEPLGSVNSPVVLPFEQLLHHQQNPLLQPSIEALTLPSSEERGATAVFYDGGGRRGATRRQDNLRVSRRVISRKGSVSLTSNRSWLSKS